MMKFSLRLHFFPSYLCKKKKKKKKNKKDFTNKMVFHKRFLIHWMHADVQRFLELHGQDKKLCNKVQKSTRLFSKSFFCRIMKIGEMKLKWVTSTQGRRWRSTGFGFRLSDRTLHFTNHATSIKTNCENQSYKFFRNDFQNDEAVPFKNERFIATK